MSSSNKNIKLTIDNREGDIKDYFTKNDDVKLSNVSITYENLDIADVVVHIDDVVFCVIERKTLSDLAASIKDGRYKDQKGRLLSTYPSSHIYYLIEGEFDYSLSTSIHIAGLSKKTILSSILNTQLRDNIKVINTKNIKETCNWLVQVLTRLSETPDKYISSASVSGSYSGSTTNGKKKMASKEDVYIQQLCQIPNVSFKTAQAIAQTYPTMSSLINALLKKDTCENLITLKDISTQDEKGKRRKLSSKVIQNIIEYVC